LKALRQRKKTLDEPGHIHPAGIGLTWDRKPILPMEAALTEPKILKDFFEAQHQKLFRRAYTLLQCTCERRLSNAGRGEWMNRKNGSGPPASAESYCPFHELRNQTEN